MKDADERYFETLEARLDRALDLAERAREGGRDPSESVEIPVAKDMADRVENILGIPGVAERVRELEGKLSREEAALELAKDFAEGTVGDYDKKAGKVEGAVRTAVALLTEGVVAAPIEGIDRVEVLANEDGTEFVNVYYAGPIRSAGGTAQALSVLVADYARSLLDLSAYRARGEEVERYAEELNLYDEDTGLQYSPKDEETKFIAEHLPIMLDGEATGDEEVEGYRDLDRVDTNNPRGGMCLVLGEGIAQKAPKIQRYTRDLDAVDWPWLEDLIEGTVGDDDDGDEGASDDGDAGAGDASAAPDQATAASADEPAGPPRAAPNKKYLRDLIAGRPVFAHPSEPGGFRLRYGRARNHGFATAGVHPATMHLVDDFLATGTQVKTERPGKAAGVVPVDTIEGPTVKLANGDVRRIDDPEEALAVRNGVEAILDLGEYLVNFGEFVENNHELVPASYTVEWWEQEFENSGADVRALRDSLEVDLAAPAEDRAIEWAREHDAPLHPAYTYCWHDVGVEQFEALAAAAAAGAVEASAARRAADGGSASSRDRGDLVLERTEPVRESLEALLVEHSQRETELRVPEWRALVLSLGLTEDLERTWTDLSTEAREWAGGDNAVAAVNEVAPFRVRERAPTRVGNRMGRPEKSEKRELSPAVHTLFPLGEAGGNQRSVAEAAATGDDVDGTRGEVEVEVGTRACGACGERTWKTACPACGGHTEPHYRCPSCGRDLQPDEAGRVHCPRCEVDGTSVESRIVDVGAEYRDALERVGERENAYDILKGVKGLSSANKTPEPIEKGVLRAKHGVSAFKDGTVRYDMTDLPVTAVRPEELDVTADQLRQLGYERDVHGDPLRHDDQLVELKVQDVVLSDGAAEHMLRTADFVDDLLASYYDLEPFYEVDDREDLVGELVFGMAPHTSAAVVGRVVGFTSAAVGYAHPYFHAAKRRNCFHPDTKVWYENEDGEWHHERIETLVEERLEDPRTDDFGTLVQELDGEVRVPSVDESGEAVLRPVEAVSKHPSPDHLVRVETRSGRRLTVTPDHDLLRWDEGGVERLPASNVDEGDLLPSPRRVNVGGTVSRFDLLSAFIEGNAIPSEDLVVRGIGSDRLKGLLDDATDAEDYLLPVADRLCVSDSTVYNWVARDSIPVAVLLELFDEEAVLDRVPDDVELSVKRDTASVSRHLEIDEAFSRLLGYYAAEGFTRWEPGEFYQTTICIPDASARSHIVETFHDKLGVDAYEENEWKLTVSSRLVAALFSEVIGLGEDAESKSIPSTVLSAPAEHLAAFLSGYFSGDGSASGDRIEVRAHTISDDLKDDIVAALKRFGVDTKVYRERRRPQTDAVAEFYDEVPQFSSWTIKITSENAVRFADRIGFDLDRKDERLQDAIESTELRSQRLFGDGGSDDVWLDEVTEVEVVGSDLDHTYNLTVGGTHTLVANDLYTAQCDGDEDCVMLLLDGLLNFSKEYLPDKRGGSVAEDSHLVAVSPDGEVTFTTFDEFWHELDSEVTRDGKFRKKTCLSEGWRTYAFDGHHRASLCPIEKAIRYPADEDETILRVETQFGRSLDITPHHSLFRYDDGIEEIAGDDLEEGDLVVAPRELDVEPVETTIDIAEVVEEPYVFIDDHVEDLLTTVWESTAHGSAAHDEFMRGLAYRLAKNKIGYGRLERILDAGGFEDVPEDVTVGLSGSETGIDRRIAVDEEFAWLLGLFVAEGTLSQVNPAIHNGNEEIVDRAVEIATDVLGTEPKTRWSKRAYEIRFPTVFEAVLHELGFVDAESYSSSEKVVPDCILRGPRGVALSFLRGFIAGDGSDKTDDNVTTVAFHTTSDDVKDGIVFLLHRLGLVGNISTRTDRDGNRQDIHTITVSGGAEDNPLHRILQNQEPYHSKSLVVSVPDGLMDIREMDVDGIKQLIPKYLKRRENVSLEKLREIVEKLDGRDLPDEAQKRLDELRPLVDGDLSYLRIESIEELGYDGYLYDLQVGGEPIFMANWLYAHNSMDAPLVMSSRIDPTEIDDEAHNMDVAEEYPLALYEASREMADPGEVDVPLAGDTLGTDEQYSGFAHTHDTGDIAAGPDLSAYKTLGSMMDKMEAQLEIARKLRAVDETDVAERVIEYHFLPDLLGNLRAFSSQEVRCLDCGEKYRRMPLSSDCRECGGDMTLTVHQGSVNKYMDVSLRVAEEYGAGAYTIQRLEILEDALSSIFENDKNRRSTLGEFM